MFGRLAWLVAATAVIGSGSYVFIYLYRWEWHRALIAGVLFVGAEVAVATAMLLSRLQRLEHLGQPGAAVPHDAVLARLRETRPHREHFAWLATSQSDLGVFIPVLLGGGIVVSGLAWLVERIAGATTAPASERRLAGDLGSISPPADGFVADDAELLAQEAPFADDEELRLLLGPSG